MSDRVKEILSWYGSDNPGTLTNLARLLNAGTLAGSGRLVMLPVDQGVEHGPGRSFAVYPPAYDPRYHFDLAIEAGCNAYAAPLGFIEAGAREFAGRVPLILKVNNHDVLLEEKDPDQAITGSVRDALRLGCVAIGFTIYPGSEHRLQMYRQIREMAEEAKANGLVVVIWSYPRGSGLSRDGETALDVTAYAAHIAAQLGAHIIKVKLPSAHLEQAAAKKVYETTQVPSSTLAERVRHVVQAAFNGRRPEIEAACIGIAGPVVDGRGTTTNLPWVVEERRLAYAIPAGRVRLLNDLEATAHGIWALGEDELVSLQSGALRRGNLAVIAAGTGLGEAIVIGDGRIRTVIATEGGHADFAPRGELEEDLLRYLRKEFGRVSYERVLSGPGLMNVYRFLRDTGVGQESAQVATAMRERDPAAVITQLGARSADRLSEMTLAVFISVYGAEAGNLALKALAVGGPEMAAPHPPALGSAPAKPWRASMTRYPPRANSGYRVIPPSTTIVCPWM